MASKLGLPPPAMPAPKGASHGSAAHGEAVLHHTWHAPEEDLSRSLPQGIGMLPEAGFTDNHQESTPSGASHGTTSLFHGARRQLRTLSVQGRNSEKWRQALAGAFDTSHRKQNSRLITAEHFMTEYAKEQSLSMPRSSLVRLYKIVQKWPFQIIVFCIAVAHSYFYYETTHDLPPEEIQDAAWSIFGTGLPLAMLILLEVSARIYVEGYERNCLRMIKRFFIPVYHRIEAFVFACLIYRTIKTTLLLMRALLHMDFGDKGYGIDYSTVLVLNVYRAMRAWAIAYGITVQANERRKQKPHSVKLLCGNCAQPLREKTFERVDADGRACAQCGEKPQVLFVHLKAKRHSCKSANRCTKRHEAEHAEKYAHPGDDDYEVWMQDHNELMAEYLAKPFVRLQKLLNVMQLQGFFFGVVLLHCFFYFLTHNFEFLSEYNRLSRISGCSLGCALFGEFFVLVMAQSGDQYFRITWHQYESCFLFMGLCMVAYQTWYAESINEGEVSVSPWPSFVAAMLLAHRTMRILGIRNKVSSSRFDADSVVAAQATAKFLNRFGDIVEVPPGNIDIKFGVDQGVEVEIKRAVLRPEAFKGLHLPFTVTGGLIEEFSVSIPGFSNSSDGLNTNCTNVKLRNLLVLFGPGDGLGEAGGVGQFGRYWNYERILEAKSKLIETICRRFTPPEQPDDEHGSEHQQKSGKSYVKGQFKNVFNSIKKEVVASAQKLWFARVRVELQQVNLQFEDPDGKLGVGRGLSVAARVGRAWLHREEDKFLKFQILRIGAFVERGRGSSNRKGLDDNGLEFAWPQQNKDYAISDPNVREWIQKKLDLVWKAPSWRMKIKKCLQDHPREAVNLMNKQEVFQKVRDAVCERLRESRPRTAEQYHNHMECWWETGCIFAITSANFFSQGVEGGAANGVPLAEDGLRSTGLFRNMMEDELNGPCEEAENVRFLPKVDAEGHVILKPEGENLWRVVDELGKARNITHCYTKDRANEAEEVANYDSVVRGIDDGDWVRIDSFDVTKTSSTEARHIPMTNTAEEKSYPNRASIRAAVGLPKGIEEAVGTGVGIIKSGIKNVKGRDQTKEAEEPKEVTWLYQSDTTPIRGAIDEPQAHCLQRLMKFTMAWIIQDNAFRWRPDLKISDARTTVGAEWRTFVRERSTIVRMWWIYAAHRVLATYCNKRPNFTWLAIAWQGSQYVRYKALLRQVALRGPAKKATTVTSQDDKFPYKWKFKFQPWEERWAKELQMHLQLSDIIASRKRALAFMSRSSEKRKAAAKTIERGWNSFNESMHKVVEQVELDLSQGLKRSRRPPAHETAKLQERNILMNVVGRWEIHVPFFEFRLLRGQAIPRALLIHAKLRGLWIEAEFELEQVSQLSSTRKPSGPPPANEEFKLETFVRKPFARAVMTVTVDHFMVVCPEAKYDQSLDFGGGRHLINVTGFVRTERPGADVLLPGRRATQKKDVSFCWRAALTSQSTGFCEVHLPDVRMIIYEPLLLALMCFGKGAHVHEDADAEEFEAEYRLERAKSAATFATRLERSMTARSLFGERNGDRKATGRSLAARTRQSSDPSGTSTPTTSHGTANFKRAASGVSISRSAQAYRQAGSVLPMRHHLEQISSRMLGRKIYLPHIGPLKQELNLRDVDPLSMSDERRRLQEHAVALEEDEEKALRANKKKDFFEKLVGITGLHQDVVFTVFVGAVDCLQVAEYSDHTLVVECLRSRPFCGKGSRQPNPPPPAPVPPEMQRGGKNRKVDEDTKHLVLRVGVVSAKGLRNADWVGKSDPFCTVEVEGMVKLFGQTPVVQDTSKPEWNYDTIIQDYESGRALVFSVWDDDARSAESLGLAILPSEQFFPQGMDAQDLRLEGDTKNKFSKDAGGAFVRVWVRVYEVEKPKPQEDRAITMMTHNFSKHEDIMLGWGDERWPMPKHSSTIGRDSEKICTWEEIEATVLLASTNCSRSSKVAEPESSWKWKWFLGRSICPPVCHPNEGAHLPENEAFEVDGGLAHTVIVSQNDSPAVPPPFLPGFGGKNLRDADAEKIDSHLSLSDEAEASDFISTFEACVYNMGREVVQKGELLKDSARWRASINDGCTEVDIDSGLVRRVSAGFSVHSRALRRTSEYSV